MRMKYRESHKIGDTRICESCGKEFVAKQENSKYCSRECGTKASNLRNGYCTYTKGTVKNTCLYCGEEYILFGTYGKFCSDKCREQYRYYKMPKSEVDKFKAQKEAEAALKRAQKEVEREERKKAYENLLNVYAERREEIKRQKDEAKNAPHTCPNCNTIFYSEYSDKIYCSDECRNHASNRRRAEKHGSTHGRHKKRFSPDKFIDNGITVKSLYKRDGGVCYLCGEKCNLEDFIIKDGTIICGDWYPSIDHVIPRAAGGEHSWGNVRLAHRRCNYLKSDKI